MNTTEPPDKRRHRLQELYNGVCIVHAHYEGVVEESRDRTRTSTSAGTGTRDDTFTATTNKTQYTKSNHSDQQNQTVRREKNAQELTKRPSVATESSGFSSYGKQDVRSVNAGMQSSNVHPSYKRVTEDNDGSDGSEGINESIRHNVVDTNDTDSYDADEHDGTDSDSDQQSATADDNESNLSDNSDATEEFTSDESSSDEDESSDSSSNSGSDANRDSSSDSNSDIKLNTTKKGVLLQSRSRKAQKDRITKIVKDVIKNIKHQQKERDSYSDSESHTSNGSNSSNKSGKKQITIKVKSASDKESERDEVPTKDMHNVSFDFIHDFMNFNPENMTTYRGVGYVRKHNDTFYIITCNHIVVKYAKYKGYCYDVAGEMAEFDMMIHTRVPELDVAILTVISHHDPPLSELPTDTQIDRIYQKERFNTVITGEYRPMAMNRSETKEVLQKRAEFLEVPISADVQMVFESLVSKHIHHVPLLNIPVDELPPIKKFVRDFKIDMQNDLKVMNPRRQFISKTVAEKVAGLSGSIVRSNGKMIGMICMYTDTTKMLSMKAVPMFLLDIIFDNVVTKGITQLMGIQVDTHPCTVDYQFERVSGHYINKKTCGYINGKKWINFVEGDIIMEVDDKKFNEHGMLWSDTMGMFVPLNTYTMIKTNSDPYSPITIKVAKQMGDDIKARNYNIMCISYNNMYRTRVSDRVCRWGDTVFIEVSEEMLMFYKRLGVDIVDTVKGFDEYSINNEKVVVVFNYKKPLPEAQLTKKMYIDMPYKGGVGFTFYSLHTVGQKKIANIDDLVSVIRTIKAQKQKTVTLKLFNDAGVVETMKIAV
ncbi:hypothetical protein YASMINEVIRUS_409 [Yasminevirus sp. GU-2018]|uniref:Uncharacterized protein n=1 Tax=Yasminevirus sp. GU-2018 TaxID=2420051 RepID=A0A5K0UA30_9VIRU|nr:hypothetical protein YASMINEVIRUS_409 [Yasminevirus sp. GU-2018]